MFKAFKEIHLWLAVPFGIIITLICFSGAMLVFEQEITRASRHDVYYVAEVAASPLPVGELMEKVKATLPDSVRITGVTICKDPERTYQVNLSKPRRASVFIDQYTGRITGRSERLPFFSFMFRMHRWLCDSANPKGDGPKIGKLTVGVSTLMFVVVLISGVVIWWPRARRNFRKSMSVPVGKGSFRFWDGLHVAGGMYVVLIVLAMALTGLTWSFPWYRDAFYAVCGVEHTPRDFSEQKPAEGDKERGEGRGEGRHGRGGHHGHGDGEGRHGDRHGGRRSEFGRWQAVYEELRARDPEAPQITVGAENASVTLSDYGNVRAADKYAFNRRSGEVTLETAYRDAAPADRLRGWIYSIHTGALGGLTTRILWFLAALLGASLPLTGYYIWIKRLRRKVVRKVDNKLVKA